MPTDRQTLTRDEEFFLSLSVCVSHDEWITSYTDRESIHTNLRTYFDLCSYKAILACVYWEAFHGGSEKRHLEDNYAPQDREEEEEEESRRERREKEQAEYTSSGKKEKRRSGRSENGSQKRDV